MTAKGHVIFALASIILVNKMLLLPPLVHGDWCYIMAGAIFTCLLPDIDHPKSFLGQRLCWIAYPISYIFGHRRFTHSILAMIVIIIFFIFLLPPEFLPPLAVYHAMIIGYLSHIIADMCTPAGVPLLWPCRWQFSFFSVKPSERLICRSALILAIMYPNDNKLLFVQPLLELDNILALWKPIYNFFALS